MVAIRENRSRWIQQSFQKDKIRARERYWHYFFHDDDDDDDDDDETNSKNDKNHHHILSSSSSSSSSIVFFWILPDGLIWRKYLKIFSTILEENENDEALSSLSETMRFVLLESTVEWMDYRNSSPVLPTIPCNDDVSSSSSSSRSNEAENNNKNNSNNNSNRSNKTMEETQHEMKQKHETNQTTTKQRPNDYCRGRGRGRGRRPEAAAVQERNRLRRMLLQKNGRNVVPFCDMSVRMMDYDEFDDMDFMSMTTAERARHGLLRASRMILQSNLMKNHDDDDNNRNMMLHGGGIGGGGGGGITHATRGGGGGNVGVVLVVDTQSDRDFFSQRLTGDDEDDEGRYVKILSADEFFDDFLRTTMSLSETFKGQISTLKEKCQAEYRIRNEYNNHDHNIMSKGRDDDDDDDKRQQDHLTHDQVEEGLKSKTLLKGRLEVTKENGREAYVVVATTNTKERYFVNGNRGHFNRAFHQDVVVLRPLPESQWSRPVGRLRLVHPHNDNAVAGDNDDDNDDDNDNEEDNDGPSRRQQRRLPSARVVAIAQPSRRTYVATLVDVPMVGDEKAIVVVPMDLRIPKIRIPTRGWNVYVNRRLLVEVDTWDVGSAYPNGHVVEILGPVGELETEITCLLEEYDVRLRPFSASALASLPSEGSHWKVPEDEVEKDDDDVVVDEMTSRPRKTTTTRRKDLRTSRRIFSVDPPGCQDIDDTMHAEILPNGDVEVGVHIADVTHFVPHDSALDREAQVRGTTFYLVDRRFDMLPSLLSSDLCSLHGHMDRLAVSVIWTFSPDLDSVRSCWYGRTVIHNCQAMTYDQAHNILHDLPPDDPSKDPPPPLTAGSPVHASNIAALKTDLSILTKLARKLRRDREEVGGAVDLSGGDLGTELKFVLDEDGNPTKVSPKQELEIHHTIAELMIMANQAVADKIYEAFPESALLRVHRSVDEGRFEDLEAALRAGGISFDGSSNMSLAKSLRQAKAHGGGKGDGKGRAVVHALWQSLATRAMSEALYVSTGSQKTDGDGDGGGGLRHYGLGIEKYTHFTSPIRRYADVVVHKQLLASLENERRRASRKETVVRPPPGFELHRPALQSLPDSSAISILSGQGLMKESREEIITNAHLNNAESEFEKDENENDDDDDLLDSLIEGAAELALGKQRPRRQQPPSTPPPPPAEDDEKKHRNRRRSLRDPEGEDRWVVPYTGDRVDSICGGLNRQNRMAKMSSMECQKLFLSLFFRDHDETVQAVITDLRANGFWAYVPKFDLRGPVYLSDRHGNVQFDPTLMPGGWLDADAGLPPTAGFASAGGGRNRLFPQARLELKNHDAEDPSEKTLVLRVPTTEPTATANSAALEFRVLDVVSLRVSCDLSDVKARVPPPRLHLVSRSTPFPSAIPPSSPSGDVAKTKMTTDKKMKNNDGRPSSSSVTSHMIQNKGRRSQQTTQDSPGRGGGRGGRGSASNETTRAPPTDRETAAAAAASSSVYELLSGIEITPFLPSAPLRFMQPRRKWDGESRHENDQRTSSSATTTAAGGRRATEPRGGAATATAASYRVAGRRVFGGFANPDTRSARQEAAVTAAADAAAQRRWAASAHQAQRHASSIGTARDMERSATSRMQRIAAEKRSSAQQRRAGGGGGKGKGK